MKNRSNCFFYSIGIPVVFIFMGLVGKALYDWKSSDVNYACKRDLYHCIYDSKHCRGTAVSMDSEFVFNYVENADSDCINPIFPAIHITTKAEHTAWLHLVSTDNIMPALQKFIDSTDQKQIDTIYPFYTLNQDFYDAPLWRYTLFKRPLSFWKGHAYAVRVDHQEKTICCMGGIEWGYELLYWRIFPKAIMPRALTVQDWEKDWVLFSEALPEYTSHNGIF